MDKIKDLGKFFGRAHRAQAKFLDEMLKPYGLWHGQLFMLKHILDGSVKCHKELCRNRLIDKAAVSRTLDKLVQSGYLQKQKDDKDKRKIVLTPTQKAKNFAPKLESLLAFFQEVALRGFSGEEQEKLFDFLERITANIKQGEQDARR